MSHKNLFLMLLLIYPLTSSAETILYACTIQGKTTLESTPSENCDVLKEYHYSDKRQLDKSHRKSGAISGLRPQEIRALKALEYRPPSRDEIIGRLREEDPLGLQSYVDSRHNECNHYTTQLNSINGYLDVKDDQLIEINPTQWAELQTRINDAQKEIDYYCGE